MKELSKDVKALKDSENIFLKMVSDKKGMIGKEAIIVRNLDFSIKKRLLLNKLNFTVKCGEIHGFLGPNGAGKTTTIKNLVDAFVTRGKDSKITIMGHDVATIEAKESISYIPEYASFPPHLTLFSYLKTMAGFSGYHGVKANNKANYLIELLELGKFKTEYPNNFSSGMKKKVLIAQALLTDPQVLILDEPAANLDPIARKFLFKALKKLASTGIAIFIASHILAELEGFVDSITMIKNGNILYSGKVSTIIDKLKDDSTSLHIYASNTVKNTILKEFAKGKYKITEEPRYLNFTSKNRNEVFSLIGELAKKKVEVEKLELNKKTLQDVYEKEYA